jgi:TRAP-type C4-dicarboxylate transport system permease small subunit
MRMLLRLLDKLSWIFAVSGLLFFAAAMLVTVYDIAGRQFGFGLFGTVDLVELFVVSGAFCSIAFATVHDRHVTVDLMAGLLSGTFGRLTRVVVSLGALALLLPMLVFGYETSLLTLRFNDTSPILGIPVFWSWVPLLIGLAITGLVYAVFAARDASDLFARTNADKRISTDGKLEENK